MIAWMAFIVWPPICFGFYRAYSQPVALCLTILGGYLLLPSVFELDLPLLPALNKTSISVLAAFALTAATIGRASPSFPVLSGWLPRQPLVLCLLVLLVIGAFGSVVSNGDLLFYGPVVLPGLRLYDAFSIFLEVSVLVLPILIARRVLATPQAQIVFLKIWVIAAVIYCFPALFEVRFSPQLHHRVYGIFPSSFAQSMRGGGFRPNVFLNHGLALAIFLTLGAMAAFGLARMARGQERTRWIMAGGFIFLTLMLCKSLGALMLAVAFVPFVFLARQRLQIVVAVCVAGAVLVYPMLRMFDLVPVDQILAFFVDWNPERAESLAFRLRNEDQLLDKARERALFGWGGWSRNFVFDASGNILSVTDGAWIIAFGEGGWARYLGVFGLLCLPIMLFLKAPARSIDLITCILILMLAVKLVDLVPNAGLASIHWLIAGGLLGRLEWSLRGGDATQAPDASGAKSQDKRLGKIQYARQYPTKSRSSNLHDSRKTGRSNARLTKQRPDK